MKVNTDDTVLWNSFVHKKLANEDLYFCAISLDDYDHEQFFVDLEDLLKNRFGIDFKNGCSFYHIFGSYDYMLRIWMPGRQARYLASQLREIRGVVAVSSFLAEKTKIYWECGEDVPSEEELEKSASSLLNKKNHQALIYRIQNRKTHSRDCKPIQKLVDSNLINLRKNVKKRTQIIKAFIAIRTSRDFGDRVLDEVEKYVEEQQALENKSYYRGIGFAALIIKVELAQSSYQDLCECIDHLNRNYMGLRVSTNTFLCMPQRMNEGGHLSEQSLALWKGAGNPQVRKYVINYCPHIYTYESNLDPKTVSDLEKFISETVQQFEEDYDEMDKECLRSFFENLSTKSEDKNLDFHAGQSLYQSVAFTEKVLRNLVKSKGPELLGDGFEDLLTTNFRGKQLKTLAMGDSIKMLDAILEESSGKERLEYLRKELESRFVIDLDKKVVGLRNEIMHAAIDNTASNWEDILKRFLALINVRFVYTQAFGES